MKKFFKTLIQSSFLACICYCVYIFPSQTLLKWAFNINVPAENLILSTLLISACISYYLRTKTKSILLKNITYLGFGSLYLIALTLAIIIAVIKVNNYYVSSTFTADGKLCVYERGTIGVRENQSCPMYGPFFGFK